MPRTCAGISEDAARAQFYRGQLLRSVLLSPGEFFKAIVPLYNALNGDYRIEDVAVTYLEALFPDSSESEVHHG